MFIHIFFFSWEIWVDYLRNICKNTVVIAAKISLRYDQHCFSNISNSIYPRISHQQAVAEHWDLPNTEIFLFKDVASLHVCSHFDVGARKTAEFFRDEMLQGSSTRVTRRICVAVIDYPILNFYFYQILCFKPMCLIKRFRNVHYSIYICTAVKFSMKFFNGEQEFNLKINKFRKSIIRNKRSWWPRWNLKQELVKKSCYW
jgi:hypothetical protein